MASEFLSVHGQRMALAATQIDAGLDAATVYDSQVRCLKRLIDDLVINPEECAAATAAIGKGPWSGSHKVELANALGDAASRTDPNSGIKTKKRTRATQCAPHLLAACVALTSAPTH